MTNYGWIFIPLKTTLIGPTGLRGSAGQNGTLVEGHVTGGWIDHEVVHGSFGVAGWNLHMRLDDIIALRFVGIGAPARPEYPDDL
jgi:hypothetical protein